MTSKRESYEYLALTIYRSFLRRGAMNLCAAMSAGMVPKDLLVDGETYIGHCRNAREAKWDAALRRFVYMRTKFSSTFPEEIEHPEDDRGFDIFVPVLLLKDLTENQSVEFQPPSPLQEPRSECAVPDQVGVAVPSIAHQVSEEAPSVRWLDGQPLDAPAGSA